MYIFGRIFVCGTTGDINMYFPKWKEDKIKKGLWVSQRYYNAIVRKFYKKKELTIKERKIINAGDIKVNSVRCLLCEDVITSHHVHDYKKCKCGNAMVDGGSFYVRCSVDDTEILTELYNDQKEEDDE